MIWKNFVIMVNLVDDGIKKRRILGYFNRPKLPTRVRSRPLCKTPLKTSGYYCITQCTSHKNFITIDTWFESKPLWLDENLLKGTRECKNCFY
jgi:hypothetical protein